MTSTTTAAKTYKQQEDRSSGALSIISKSLFMLKTVKEFISHYTFMLPSSSSLQLFLFFPSI